MTACLNIIPAVIPPICGRDYNVATSEMGFDDLVPQGLGPSADPGENALLDIALGAASPPCWETSCTSRGVTMNSFMLPGMSPWMEAELNSWPDIRGPAPKSWFSCSGPATQPGWVATCGDDRPGGNANCALGEPPAAQRGTAWPYSPLRPGGQRGHSLCRNDYVILRGTLWQDAAHEEGWWCDQLGGVFCSGSPESACWETGHLEGHGGWMEIHPVDAVTYVPESVRPAALKYPFLTTLCVPRDLFNNTQGQTFAYYLLSSPAPGACRPVFLVCVPLECQIMAQSDFTGGCITVE
ncbi:MAG: hypothetical protein ACREMY_21000, partial [bacterium]